MQTPIDASPSPAPAQHVVLNRQVELEVTLDQLWSLVSEPENLADWLGDDINLDMSPGSVGTVVDDGVIRHVRIDRVVRASRLEFTWWRSDEPSDRSVVVFEVEELPAGNSRLHISETLLSSDAGAAPVFSAAERWEIRIFSLWACTVAMALVP